MKQLLFLLSFCWFHQPAAAQKIAYKVKLARGNSTTVVPKIFFGTYQNGSLQWTIEYGLTVKPPQEEKSSFIPISAVKYNNSVVAMGTRYVKFKFAFFDSLKRIIGDTSVLRTSIMLSSGQSALPFRGEEEHKGVLLNQEPHSALLIWEYYDVPEGGQKPSPEIWNRLGSELLPLREHRKFKK